MFLGYQNDLLALTAETREELENNPNMEFTSIEETGDVVEKVGNSYYVGQEAVSAAKASYIRQIRNAYLEEFVDRAVANPLHWSEMPEEEKIVIKNYRNYLLNLPQETDFPDVKVQIFDEWKTAQPNVS